MLYQGQNLCSSALMLEHQNLMLPASESVLQNQSSSAKCFPEHFFIFNLSQNFIFKARAFHKPSDSMKGIFHCFALESDASTMIQYLILNSTGMFRRGSQSYKENDIKNGKMQGLACDCQEFFQRGQLWGSLSTLFVSSF